MWYSKPPTHSKVVGPNEATDSTRAFHWDLCKVWHATSADGLKWKEQGIAIPRGPQGRYDHRSVFNPDILVANGKYYMFIRPPKVLSMHVGRRAFLPLVILCQTSLVCQSRTRPGGLGRHWPNPFSNREPKTRGTAKSSTSPHSSLREVSIFFTIKATVDCPGSQIFRRETSIKSSLTFLWQLELRSRNTLKVRTSNRNTTLC